MCKCNGAFFRQHACGKFATLCADFRLHLCKGRARYMVSAIPAISGRYKELCNTFSGRRNVGPCSAAGRRSVGR